MLAFCEENSEIFLETLKCFFIGLRGTGLLKVYTGTLTTLKDPAQMPCFKDYMGFLHRE